MFGGYAGQHIDNRGDATSASVTLGVGYQPTDSWQSGGIYARTSQRQQPSSRFDYHLHGDLVALYSQLQLGGQGGD
ncbi:autotransporter outer membrane beta-barrel domain-containing protein|nr:autotransporter outer membrane beta-barrel domain-containing protein [Candidatus Pantoea persica]